MPRIRPGVRPFPVIAVTAALFVSACGSDSSGTTTENAAAADSGLPAVVAQSGTLRVGMSPDFPPMEYQDPKTQDVIGIDVEMVTALGKQLGVQIKIVEQSFDQLLNSVQTGRVDIVMSGLSDTVERQKTVSFVDYFGSQGRFYTRQADATKYTASADLCGTTLAVSKKTDYYLQVQDFSKATCAGAGKPEIKLLPTDSGSAARLQLEQGRVDVAVQGGENLAYFEKTKPDSFETILEPLESKPFGIVMKKDDTEMSAAILKGMQALVADGTYKKILTANDVEYAIITPALNGTKE